MSDPKKTAAVSAPSHDKGRTRSPSYPIFGLEEALRKTRTLWDRHHQHFAGMSAIADEWETNTKSSAFLQAISAIKQFGLIEDQGKGESRQARISDLAKTIFIRDDASDPDRIAAIKRAAVAPKLHRELWKKYDGNLPPSESPIRVYLLQERKDGTFHKDHVDSFIRQFRATIAFAALTSSDIIAPVDEDELAQEEQFMENKQNPNISNPAIQQMPPKGSAPYISFPLPRGNAVEIRLKAKLSPSEFATLKKLLELSEDSLVDGGS